MPSVSILSTGTPVPAMQAHSWGTSYGAIWIRLVAYKHFLKVLKIVDLYPACKHYENVAKHVLGSRKTGGTNARKTAALRRMRVRWKSISLPSNDFQFSPVPMKTFAIERWDI